MSPRLHARTAKITAEGQEDKSLKLYVQAMLLARTW